jgi:hypothetical protein
MGVGARWGGGLDSAPPVRFEAEISDNACMNKLCSKCHVEKPLDQFYKDTTMKDGRGYYCKQCSAPRTKQDYEDNKALRQEYGRTHYARNREAKVEYAKTFVLKTYRLFVSRLARIS